ncbi:hypothetical protein B5X24_HaOG208135 [Helicoverpa armigera]|uniref:Uncharacterized protein n=1 Tax=Helicoverpa armigera TaxID=29058 RepID=A0A2W1BJ05_HELAM|nr:hypothetical protein B5X24_HaOG208135 [Helicoverpa armigera]
MKYFLVFLIVCVALAAASPQLIAAWPGWPGYAGVVPATRTLVAGPTVVNQGARIIAPGYII